jgi:NAD(P)-dependent dehydrogenase (short-subunit alcohol dehydrogenase family)
MNVVITGANRGLGLALTSRFAGRAGHHVFAVSRDPDASPELAELVRVASGQVTIVRADVADATAADTIAAAVGRATIDLLVNNAGAMDEHHLGDLSQADLIALFNVNAFAPLLVTQALRPRLAEHAKIVNITSVLGSIARAGAGYLAYGMSKAALNMLTKKLAAEMPGIAVLSLHPGWVQTRMGGPGASIDVDTSADGMLRVIDGLAASKSGSYVAYDGSAIPW